MGHPLPRLLVPGARAWRSAALRRVAHAPRGRGARAPARPLSRDGGMDRGKAQVSAGWPRERSVAAGAHCRRSDHGAAPDEVAAAARIVVEAGPFLVRGDGS
jgi:hypothetical protein